MKRNKDKVYGLEQALRDSMNSWFAWLFERADGTLLNNGEIAGLPHSRALVPGALDEVRPLQRLLRRLGLQQPQDLSGGLLSKDYPWRVRDGTARQPGPYGGRQ